MLAIMGSSVAKCVVSPQELSENNGRLAAPGLAARAKGPAPSLARAPRIAWGAFASNLPPRHPNAASALGLHGAREAATEPDVRDVIAGTAGGRRQHN